MKHIVYLFAAALALCSCQQQQPADTAGTPVKMPAPKYQPVRTTYRLVSDKDSIKHFEKYFTSQQQLILCAVNRADAVHVATMDSILVPSDMTAGILQYSPFPEQLPALQQVSKIIFFSYPAQYFGAYEHGELVYSGPTNMGREKDPTPTGLFYTNWKAEETRSTFNDEWELKWNVNIANKEGVGWHQYALPGYPASHSCLRLQEADAKDLYSWASVWTLNGDEIVTYGTPVIVFGTYPFGSARPWMQLTGNPHALDIKAATLDAEANTHLTDIYAKQAKRDTVKA